MSALAAMAAPVQQFLGTMAEKAAAAVAALAVMEGMGQRPAAAAVEPPGTAVMVILSGMVPAVQGAFKTVVLLCTQS